MRRAYSRFAFVFINTGFISHDVLDRFFYEGIEGGLNMTEQQTVDCKTEARFSYVT